MSADNPYRAAGAFAGKAYIRRGADAALIEQIHDNQYYPYFAAPRQSGKSSLIARTMTSLPAPQFRCALVDLSPFVVRSYDDFWRQFLHEVARSANFDPTPIGADPRDVFEAWLASFPGRLVIFVDEIDVLLHVECREQIFSKIRSFFNLRAHSPAMQRLTFVLAGAAHSSRFISDPRWSPFNVAIEIPLEDLTAPQVSQLASYLATAGAFAGPDLVARVYELTGGSVFLCQLVFEALWSRAARGKKKLEASDVDEVVDSIVAESPRNIHFYNIFRLVTQDARLAMLFRRLVDGEELGEEDRKELQLTGLCRGMDPFRNEVYARVFGPGGPLDLKVAGHKAALGRKLEAALSRREQLAEAGAATTEIEAEIAALRREFREGGQLREGDVLGRGRYRLLAPIGQGGFATVWRARDETAKREVALKVLHGQFAEDKTRRDRFFRGAWKMSELRHPAIVQVFEPYGEEGGRYYFVMEFLPGGTLHEAVLDKKLEADAVIAGIVAVGQALAHAHAHGLVHRDVKPSNVMLGAGGAAKLTDFDLVREQDAAGTTRTGPMGSFIYAAPEVLHRPQDADHRADIYGLAMTAVFGLYRAELPLEVVRDADRFIDRLHCNGLTKDVLKKGVAWEVEQRFASAAEFTQALATAWAEKEVPAPAPPPSPPQPKRAMGAIVAPTLPPPETGPPAAQPAPPLAEAKPAPARSEARAPVAEAEATMAALAGDEAAATQADGSSEAPTQVTRAPREAFGPAAPLPAAMTAAPPERQSKGLFAALGLFASAALVLLALQIARPKPWLETNVPVAPTSAGGRTEPSAPEARPNDAGATRADLQDPTEATGGPQEAREATGGAVGPVEATEATTSGPEPAEATEGAQARASGGETEGEAETAPQDTARPPATTGSAGSDKPASQPKRTTKKSVAARIDDGCLKVRFGNAETGVQILREAREDRPHDAELLRCLAQGLQIIGDYIEAENYYKQLLAQTHPRNLPALLGLAQVNELLGRRERAANYYEMVLTIDPDNKSARAFLGSKAGAAARGSFEGFELP